MLLQETVGHLSIVNYIVLMELFLYRWWGWHIAIFLAKLTKTKTTHCFWHQLGLSVDHSLIFIRTNFTNNHYLIF